VLSETRPARFDVRPLATSHPTEVVSEELVWEPLPAITARLDLPTLFARMLGTA